MKKPNDEIKKYIDLAEWLFENCLFQGHDIDGCSVFEKMIELDIIEERAVNPEDNEWEVDKLYYFKDKHQKALQDVQWQPIETVPRDMEVLLYENGAMYKGQYWYYCEDEKRMFFDCDCGQYIASSPKPTHWMPLPQPPEGGDR